MFDPTAARSGRHGYYACPRDRRARMRWGSDITRRTLAALVAVAALAFPAQAAASGAGVAFGVLGIASGAESANLTVAQIGGNIVVADPTQDLGALPGCSANGSPAK